MNPLHRDFMHKSLEDLTDEERERLETYLTYCLETGLTVEYVAASYDRVVKDQVREQVYFKRHGRYRHTSYAEVADSVYHHPEYMSLYMHGLAITEFLWPNHRSMFRFFLRTLPRHLTGRYLEVGPGHGLFMIAAMRRGSFCECVGVDISDTSIGLTRSVLEHPLYGPFKNYRLERRDFLATDLRGPFDAIAMGEVLEHVEDPGAFLRRARELLAADGYFYMSTALNAAVIDHIYLFRTVAELEEMIAQAGLHITDKLVLPHVGASLDECERDRLPVNVAYALT